MAPRSWQLKLAAALVVGTAIVPAAGLFAATSATSGIGIVDRPMPAPMPPAVGVKIDGLYDFNADGRTGWLLLRTDRRGMVNATIRLDHVGRREVVLASYDRRQQLLRLTRTEDGYVHRYSLWLAHQSGTKLSFGGYGERQPMRPDPTAAGAVTAPRYGVQADYIAADLL